MYTNTGIITGKMFVKCKLAGQWVFTLNERSHVRYSILKIIHVFTLNMEQNL